MVALFNHLLRLDRILLLTYTWVTRSSDAPVTLVFDTFDRLLANRSGAARTPSERHG
ncbi:MAG TPA: hypothetical protein VMS64_12570 [Candidatus Methylomirabilis sp.]|nr:hypothetical protein [Candidatus Methylomirabilis sp.]